MLYCAVHYLHNFEIIAKGHICIAIGATVRTTNICIDLIQLKKGTDIYFFLQKSLFENNFNVPVTFCGNMCRTN